MEGVEIESTNSQESKVSSSKRMLYKLVKGQNKEHAIQIIDYLGFLALLVLSGLAVQ